MYQREVGNAVYVAKNPTKAGFMPQCCPAEGSEKIYLRKEWFLVPQGWNAVVEATAWDDDGHVRLKAGDRVRMVRDGNEYRSALIEVDEC